MDFLDKIRVPQKTDSTKRQIILGSPKNKEH